MNEWYNKLNGILHILFEIGYVDPTKDKYLCSISYSKKIKKTQYNYDGQSKELDYNFCCTIWCQIVLISNTESPISKIFATSYLILKVVYQ